MRIISFLEECKVIEKIDLISKTQGSDRSAFIRLAIREKLKREAPPTP